MWVWITEAEHILFSSALTWRSWICTYWAPVAGSLIVSPPFGRTMLPPSRLPGVGEEKLVGLTLPPLFFLWPEPDAPKRKQLLYLDGQEEFASFLLVFFNFLQLFLPHSKCPQQCSIIKHHLTTAKRPESTQLVNSSYWLSTFLHEHHWKITNC